MLAASGHGTGDSRQRALSGVQFLIDRQCDGIILTTNSLRDTDIVELRRRQPRMVVVNRDVKGSKTHCFTVDHKHAGRLAAQALLANGHREIAVISGLQNAPDNRQRLRGFLDELADAGIARTQVTIADADFTAQGGWRATELLLQRGSRFTGLFCCNDQMAMAAMSCLHAAGKSVPGDVSVVGYDDADIAPFLSPRLTTVHIAIASMGQHACRMMLNLSYGTDLPVAYEFPAKLVMRESLGPARKQARTKTGG
jgi:LacI family transcriptional regulator